LSLNRVAKIPTYRPSNGKKLYLSAVEDTSGMGVLRLGMRMNGFDVGKYMGTDLFFLVGRGGCVVDRLHSARRRNRRKEGDILR
jgi:hypothetical protein